jgi:hypothetical protein
MFNVYQIGGETQCELCRPVHADDWDRIREEVGGDRAAASWTPMEVQIIASESDGSQLRYSDAPWIAHNALVLRPRAREVFLESVRTEVEMLPLVCADEDLVLVNVLTVLPALDEERAKITRLPSGVPLSVSKYEFLPEVIGQARIFKLSGWRASPVFATEALRSAYLKAALAGLSFRKVWSTGGAH